MSKKILFFGSGPVAAESLQLLAQDFEIEAVITKPRPAHHKGDVPVVELAEELGFKTVTASNKKELDDLFSGKPFESDLAILIDFGIIVSQKVIDYFPLGIINSHFSLLPQWRGADPITFSILSGQKNTGVSLMLLAEAMDEGPLLAYGEYELSTTVTTPELTQGLIELSHELLKNVVPQYVAGAVEPAPQTITGHATSYSRKLTKDDGVLDFNKSAAELEREVRAYLGWPRSRTTIGDAQVVITQAHVIEGSGKLGQLWTEAKQLGFYTKDGILVIDKLVPAGKKEMSSEGFLAGYKF